MKIDKKIEDIKATDVKVYGMMTDFRALSSRVPPQAEDWKADENHCEFTIKGMMAMKVDIAEKKEFNKVVYQLSNDKGMPATIVVDINGKGKTCDVALHAEMQVPVFMEFMLKGAVNQVLEKVGGSFKTAIEQA